MKKSIPFWVLMLIIWILFGCWLYHCCCCCCNTRLESSKSYSGLNITDEDGFSAKTDDNFSFKVNDFELHDLKPTVTTTLKSAVDYLNSNPEKGVMLEGNYLSGEENNSIYPDLGIARATALKNWFINQGVSADRILLNSKLLQDSSSLQGDTLWGGTSISFSDLEIKRTEDGGTSIEETKIDDAIVSKLKANPMVLYFETNASSLNPTAQQRQDFADISKFLALDQTAKLLINGHADNVGQTDHNLKLSQDRANFAKSVLVRNGVSSAQINVKGFGSSQPIASNNTEAGKSKNRRVEITFQ